MSMQFRNSTVCNAVALSAANVTQYLPGEKVIEKWEAIVINIVIGVVVSVIAEGYAVIRKHVYKDKHNLDTTFDAGGKVNVGLTATTIAAQWTWVSALSYSPDVVSRIGISGSLWYAVGGTIQILLFSILSVQLKIRAPGAKTFLQVIRARFGKTTHIVYCFFALLTNSIVTGLLMLGGSLAITGLVKGMTVEFATSLTVATVGAYTYIGGLGATFYVSYFNTAIMCAGMVLFFAKVFDDDSADNPLGSVEDVYSYVSCLVGPSGNLDRSYVTIQSKEGLEFALIMIVGNFGTLFIDQSYWQSSVAAKPKQGVLGFLAGGLVWFALPFCTATSMGLGYMALSSRQGKPLVSDDQAHAGLILPTTAHMLLGRTGSTLVLVMLMMALTSTGSAEVIAVTSILVCDVYATYVKPYRKTTDTNNCILCGKGRGRMARPRDKCVCIVMAECIACLKDDDFREDCRRAVRPDYTCTMHGPYREYMDYLDSLKNWCLVWTCMLILPLTIGLHMLGLSQGWLVSCMGILIGSSVPAIALSLTWVRLSWIGMVAGSVGGATVAVVVWLVVASSYPGGLWDFFHNTGRDKPMLIGNAVSIAIGGIITVAVSMATNRRLDPAEALETWENTRDIDNPLSPWQHRYAEELKLTNVHQVDNRPTLDEVSQTFKTARYVAYIGSVLLSLTLAVFWPSYLYSLGVFSLQEFRKWIKITRTWISVAFAFVLIAPLLNEMWDICKAIVANRKVSSNPRTRQFTVAT